MSLIFYISSKAILLRSYARLEERQIRRNTDQVVSALNEQLSVLNAINYDWSAWDNTYSFIEDGNSEYIRSNLVDETFSGLRLNFMLFIDSSKRIIFGKSFDLQEEKEIPIPQTFLDHVLANDILLNHQELEAHIEGMLLLPDHVLLISSRPILTSEDEGPIRGALILGRYLDDTEIRRLSETTHSSLILLRYDELRIPADFLQVRPLLSKETPIVIRPLSKESIAGYTFLQDIYGNPSLLLRVDLSRDIYRQGQATVRYFVVLLLCAGLAFSTATMVLLEKSILLRMSKLRSSIMRIGESDNLAACIPVAGKDELSDLACSINKMLDSLEQSRYQLIKSEERNRALLAAVPDFIFLVRRDGLFLDYSKEKNGNFPLISSDLLGKNIYEVLPEQLARQTMESIENTLQTGEMQIFEHQFAQHGDTRFYEVRLLTFGTDIVLVIIRDITDCKQAEQAQRNEVLMKEIHHRVKNNLQLISSMLYLQSQRMKDRNLSKIFKDNQTRIRSIALIHEKLYRSKDLVRLSYSEYIQDLISSLLNTYDANSNIKIKFEIDDLFLGMDIAIPCGMITNELVSNSLQHAFPDEQEGEIRIGLNSGYDKKIVLTVSDNGIGFPEDIDFRQTESFGLKLVDLFCKQLEAVIELDRSTGTEFKVSFMESAALEVE